MIHSSPNCLGLKNEYLRFKRPYFIKNSNSFSYRINVIRDILLSMGWVNVLSNIFTTVFFSI